MRNLWVGIRFAIAPFDVVKIRLQLQSQRQHLPFLTHAMPGSVKYNGLVHGLKVIAAEEGIRVSVCLWITSSRQGNEYKHDVFLPS